MTNIVGSSGQDRTRAFVKASIWLSASLLALAGATAPAAASEADEQSAPGTGETATTSDGGADQQSGIRDIIVTATRQATNLQDTPIAITAVTSEALATRGLTNSADLGGIIPNATFRRTGGAFGPGLSAFIRGIGQSDTGFASEPGVAFYIDDVYYPLVFGSMFDLLDLDHVEVLRGPQGTLFGRNALAGAVNLVSKRASLTDASAYGEATVGRYDRREFRMGFNMPISGTAAISVSAVSKQRTGYQEQLDFRCDMERKGTPQLAGKFPYYNGLQAYNGNPDCVIGHLGGEDVHAIRGQFYWKPVSNLAITISGDYDDERSENAADSVFVIDAALAASRPNVTSMFGLYTAPGGPAFAYDSRFLTGSPYKTYATFQDPVAAGTTIPGNTFYNGSPFRGGLKYSSSNPTTSWGISGKLVYGIASDIDVTLVGGYRSFETQYAFDVDGTPLAIENNANNAEQTSWNGELRLSGKKDWIDWIVGAFYYRGEATLHFAGSSDYNATQRFQNNQFKPVSKAAYANVTLRPLPRLGVTLGGRYSDDKKPVYFNSVLDGTTASSTSFVILPSGSTIFNVPINDSHFDWKLGVNYDVAEHTMVYASAATGSRLPGFNSRPLQPSQAVQYAGDKTLAYELGIKSDLFDRRLRLNLAAFYTDYRERALGISGQEALSGANGTPVTGNQVVVPSPSGQGVTICQPAPVGTPGVTCIGRTFYINSPGKVKGLEGEFEARPIDRLTLSGSFGYSNFSSPDLDARPAGTNKRLLLVPDWTASGGIQYEIPVEALGGTITPRLDWLYQGSIVYSVTHTELNQPGYSVFNGRIGYNNPERQFTVAVGATNLFNKFYWNNFFVYQDLGYPQMNGQPSRPREWYLTIGKKF